MMDKSCKNKDTKNHVIRARITEEEKKKIEVCCEMANLNCSELILLGIDLVYKTLVRESEKDTLEKHVKDVQETDLVGKGIFIKTTKAEKKKIEMCCKISALRQKEAIMEGIDLVYKKYARLYGDDIKEADTFSDDDLY